MAIQIRPTRNVESSLLTVCRVFGGGKERRHHDDFLFAAFRRFLSFVNRYKDVDV